MTANGVTPARILTSDADIEAALEQARRYESIRPKAVHAAYRAKDDLLFIRLASGVEIAVPRSFLPGLENATADEMHGVEVQDSGSALYWKALDVGRSIPELLDDVSGKTQWFGLIGEKGGSRKSSAKTLAVRANGAKGGRPRKIKQ